MGNTPHFLSFLAGSHHHSLFTLQRYVKSWQIPNTTLLSAKILFQQTSAIRDWVFWKRFLTDCLAYCPLGLPFFYARKKAKVMTVMPECFKKKLGFF